MARDGQIKLPDGGSPVSYEVPNATEIIPKVVTAVFDGTGAAGSFVPTVEIVSDGGVVVARVPCQTTVAAGGSCECTFAPFLRASATAGPLAPQFGLYNTASLSLAGGGGGGLATWQYQSGTELLDLTTPTAPKVMTAGLYFVGVSFSATGPWNAGKGLHATVETINLPAKLGTAMALADSFAFIPEGFVAILADLPAGDGFQLAFTNRDSAARSVFAVNIDVQLIGTA